MNFDPKWMETAQQFQKTMMDNWAQALGASTGGAAPANPFAAMSAFSLPMGQMPAMPSAGAMAPDFGQLTKLLTGPNGLPAKLDAAKVIDIQKQYLQDVAALWNQGLQVKPSGDRRFAAGRCWPGGRLSRWAR